MHDHGIMYRDLKSENITHDSKHILKIDFGTSRTSRRRTGTSS